MDISARRQGIFDKDESFGYAEREAAIDGFLKLAGKPGDGAVEPGGGADKSGDGADESGGGAGQQDGFSADGFDMPVGQAERYVAALEYVLERLSTPVDGDELIVGRMVEGPIRYEMEVVPAGGGSHAGTPFRPTARNGGHMSLDYGRLLRKGLVGITEEAEAAARAAYSEAVNAAGRAANAVAAETAVTRSATLEAALHAALSEAQADCVAKTRYAGLARRAAEAVGKWAGRWGEAAAAAGNMRAARALRVVPAGPAYDFFSAVQSVWFVEMVLSCVTGARDFAYSRLDIDLLPYFDEADSDNALEILTSFMLLNNEIGGLRSELNNPMPVPCAATNIYLMLGGRGAEGALPLSLLFLKAAEAVKLPQPVLALRIDKNGPKEWKLACMGAAQRLEGQAALYNDDALIASLEELGYSAAQAENYTMSGCNRAEFPGQQSSDYFHNCPQWLLNAFYDEAVNDMDGLMAAFGREARAALSKCAGNKRVFAGEELRFSLESFLLDGCMESACDLENGGLAKETVVHNLCGLATVADSLAAIETLVFNENTLTLDEFRELVKNDYNADSLLRTRIALQLPKYGNDDARADKWAAAAGEILAQAVRELSGLAHAQAARELSGLAPAQAVRELSSLAPAQAAHTQSIRELSSLAPAQAAPAQAVSTQAASTNIRTAPADAARARVHIPSFYSLFIHQAMGERTGATPDGRVGGTPISENQSPAYGNDTRGATALLRSAASLPQRLCGAGGLNIRFPRLLDDALLLGLVESYFAMGGVNLAVNIVSRQTLIEARERPELYRGLLVRVVGYSDVFVNLPDRMQYELIMRTESAV